MTSHATATATTQTTDVLDQDDATRQSLLLAELQAALTARGTRSVLARRHRLVLRSGDNPYEPSGPTRPELHIFTAHGTLVTTTDGQDYHLPGSQPYPASDPHATALALTSSHPGTHPA